MQRDPDPRIDPSPDAEARLASDMREVVRRSVEAVLPEAAVREALAREAFAQGLQKARRVTLLSVGKAAWRMAKAALEALAGREVRGLVVTKYGHAMGDLPGLELIESAHPVPDANSLRAGARALELADAAGEGDAVLLLLSGGGSALMEDLPAGVTLAQLAELTRALLACGADIRQINAVRKHLSNVKGGRLAQWCAPARVYCVALSDVLGDAPDAIASGPAAPDASTSAEALQVLAESGYAADDAMRAALSRETPKALPGVELAVTGSVRLLAQAAAQACRDLGYAPLVLTASMDCEAREAGALLAAMARDAAAGASSLRPPCALILGGETVVHLRGHGRGGRNQELAAAAGLALDGVPGVCVCSLGSDGTDGPTDAAGGIVTGAWAARCRAAGLDPRAHLDDNDTYPLLARTDALLVTGPTGTNVNDVAVALIR